MTRLHWYLLAGLGVLFGIGLGVHWLAPTPVDWTLSLETDDHRPFGSQVPFVALQAALPEQEVTAEQRSPYPLLRSGAPERPTVAIITRQYAPGRAETEALLDYVASGHTVLLSVHALGQHLQEALHVELSDTHNIEALALVHPALQGSGPYPLGEAYATHLTTVDKERATILGTGTTHGGETHPTFVRLERGEGALLLHTAPLAFTNYFVLEDNRIEYLYGAAAYLPDRPVMWADYYAPTRADAATPFRYVLMNPSLRAALYLLMGMVLLLMLDGARRRQRMIPVVEPPPNTTLEFVSTVGRLAHRQGNHTALAQAMRRHFATTIHYRYGLAADDLSATFSTRLARRSGAPLETVRALAAALRRVDDPAASWSAQDVVQFRRRLDAFYHETEGRLWMPAPHGTISISSRTRAAQAIG